MIYDVEGLWQQLSIHHMADKMLDVIFAEKGVFTNAETPKPWLLP